MIRLGRMAALVLVLAGSLGLAACEELPDMPSMPKFFGEDTLYERMGGEERMSMIVAQFVANMNTDEKLSHRFAGADMDKVRAGMTEQFCQATGGPCEYQGREMAEAHTGMDISDKEFKSARDSMRRALVVFSVPDREREEFLAVFSGMKGEIVGL